MAEWLRDTETRRAGVDLGEGEVARAHLAGQRPATRCAIRPGTGCCTSSTVSSASRPPD